MPLRTRRGRLCKLHTTTTVHTRGSARTLIYGPCLLDFRFSIPGDVCLLLDFRAPCNNALTTNIYPATRLLITTIRDSPSAIIPTLAWSNKTLFNTHPPTYVPSTRPLCAAAHPFGTHAPAKLSSHLDRHAYSATPARCPRAGPRKPPLPPQPAPWTPTTYATRLCLLPIHPRLRLRLRLRLRHCWLRPIATCGVFLP
jgi:hypothetical protein